MEEYEIEAVTVPVHPALVAAMERARARRDALLESLTEVERAKIKAAEWTFECQLDRLLFGDTEE